MESNGSNGSNLSKKFKVENYLKLVAELEAYKGHLAGIQAAVAKQVEKVEESKCYIFSDIALLEILSSTGVITLDDNLLIADISTQRLSIVKHEKPLSILELK